MPALHGDDPAEQVDGRYALGVVAAVLADDAECLGAQARRRLAPPALAREADVVGPADAGLALAAFLDESQGFHLREYLADLSLRVVLC